MSSSHPAVLIVAAAMVLVAASAGCRRESDPAEAALDEAIELIRQGAPEAALKRIGQLGALTNSPAAQSNLGIAHWHLGNTDAALGAFRAAIETNAPDVRIVLLLATLLTDERRYDAALALLDELREPSPKSLTLAAMAQYRAGRPDRALELLNRAAELDSGYPPALFDLAVLSRDMRLDVENAGKYYRRFQQAAPTHPLAVPGVDAFLRRNPQLADMLAARTPDKSSAPAAGTPAGSPSVLREAREARADGDMEAALIMYRQAVRENPGNPDALWELADFYAEQLGFDQRAQELRQKFRRMFPDDSRAADVRLPESERRALAAERFQAGLTYHRRQEWARAVAAYREALDLDPSSAGAAYNLGLSLKSAGDIGEAARAFERAVELQGDLVKARYMLGLIEKERGNAAKALSHLNKLLGTKPDYPRAHFLLALVYRDTGKRDAAKTHFEKYLLLEPDGASAAFAKEWLAQENAARGSP